MKKIILFAIILTEIAVAFAQTPTAATSSHTRTLIAYFSATGNTRRAAHELASEFNADLFEITPEVPYTIDDLNFCEKDSRTTMEFRNYWTCRPAIKGRCENIANYDTVWIGFPIWWYAAPNIINTFIEAYDFSGKVLNVFATSGGSDVNGVADNLHEDYPQYLWNERRLMNQYQEEHPYEQSDILSNENIIRSGYVDLGLASGTKWKAVNEDGYYSYEQAKSLFEDKTHQIPTKSQWEELMYSCRWTWKGNGYIVTGSNGKSIFFPVTSRRYCSGEVDETLWGFACYWTQTPFDEDLIWDFTFAERGMAIALNYRCAGEAVRLVQSSK